MTEEQERISKKNYRIAAKHLNVQYGEHLHHINPEWRHNDVERYIQWNFDDLVKMSISDHVKLHWQIAKGDGEMYEEWCRKISESQKGNHWNWCDSARKRKSEYYKNHDNPFKGKHHTDETKKKISQANSGNAPFKGKTHSDETKIKISELAKERFSNPQNHPMYGKECPNKGKKYYNNGVEQVLAFECPIGYVKGRLKRYATSTVDKQQDESGCRISDK